MNEHKRQKKKPKNKTALIRITLIMVATSFAPSYPTSRYCISLPMQCFKDINICTIFRKKIHIECAESVIWKQFIPRQNPLSLSFFLALSLAISLSSPSSVKSLVPLLSLLENYGSHHSAHHDSQQSTQQEQEDLPAGERRSAEVTGRIINVVCEK